MHPDVEQFALFWIIEPLPIHTLTIYIIDQTFLPIPCNISLYQKSIIWST